jgi:hypothetical protein
MFDPFTVSDPPVLVHEVDGKVFEEAWTRFDAADKPACPICGEGDPQDHGHSPYTTQQWIRFSCGDFISREVTAG